MEKYDFEKFGITPVSIQESTICVRVGSSLFKVFLSDLLFFAKICMASGLDFSVESADNEHLKF